MKPFLKWAGGKYRIVDQVKAALPKGKRLIEPFAGSGAVFLNADYPASLIADSNADLINLFLCVQSGGQGFADYGKALFVQANNQEAVFYKLREEFNFTKDTQRKAALFIYLNRHCFNGLCRYNSKGHFNVPFGRYIKPSFPEKELLNFWQKSQSATFTVSDFVATMESAQLGDVVYCDPPYMPLTDTANFTNYTRDGFGISEQQALANLAVKLQSKGIPVVISNHDTDFTRAAYSTARIEAFDVQRFISSNSKNRGKAGEILAIFS